MSTCRRLLVGDQKGGTQSVMNVATLKGRTGHSPILAALRRAGLRADDVRFVFIAPSKAKSALAAGSVDAWATWGPCIALARAQDGARGVVNGRELMSGQSYTVASTDNSCGLGDIIP